MVGSSLAATSGATVAYFSMEVGIDPALPTYSGGLGVLAGDTLRSAADLRAPIVGVTLLHRGGYFRQSLDDQGRQSEAAERWSPEELLEKTDARASVEIEGRAVHIRAFRYRPTGVTGGRIPIYFLDTDLPENDARDRDLSGQLYQGDAGRRLRQETVLGIGGVAILEALGIGSEVLYHMNEGHAALLALALLEQRLGAAGAPKASREDIEHVRRRCIFTTHTPVPAGHDKFDRGLVEQVLGQERTAALAACDCLMDGTLNMTYLALRFSRYVNGVSMKHGEVSSGMFPDYPVSAITNGVHAMTWTAPPFRELFDRRIHGWREDNLYLRYAMDIPLAEIQAAHAQTKQALIEEIERRTGRRLDERPLTIGFARRATPYKRADLLFTDLEHLRAIARRMGPFQIVYGGKAHPADGDGKRLIERVHEASRALGDDIPVVYLENYDMELAQKLIAGVDLWLNTPLRPQEASGTSGMKAALNGVPSFSVLDGWWIEGHVEGVTGWSIQDPARTGTDEADARALYHKLEDVILPLYHGRPPAYADIRRHAIALNGSFFNTQRMLRQYVTNAYFPASRDA